MSSRLASRAAWSSSAFAELDANVSHLGREGGDTPVELVDVIGCTEPGGLPGLLAHELGEATLELLHAGGVAGAAGPRSSNGSRRRSSASVTPKREDG